MALTWSRRDHGGSERLHGIPSASNVRNAAGSLEPSAGGRGILGGPGVIRGSGGGTAWPDQQRGRTTR